MEFFFVKYCETSIIAERGLKLVMEHKAKIEGKKTRVFGDSAQTICSIFFGE